MLPARPGKPCFSFQKREHCSRTPNALFPGTKGAADPHSTSRPNEEITSACSITSEKLNKMEPHSGAPYALTLRVRSGRLVVDVCLTRRH
jgi:hypothetical protein